MQNEEKEEGQMLYYVEVKLAWKIKRGSSHINNYRDYQFITRAKTVEHINRSPEMIAKLMAHFGLTGKKIFDFYIKEEISRKEMTRSFANKEKDYRKEFGI